MLRRPIDWQQASEEQKVNLSRQLADIYISLKQHSFGRLGRLQISPTEQIEVAPACFNYSADAKPTPVGPFTNSNDYHIQTILQRIELLRTYEVITSASIDVY